MFRVPVTGTGHTDARVPVTGTLDTGAQVPAVVCNFVSVDLPYPNPAFVLGVHLEHLLHVWLVISFRMCHPEPQPTAHSTGTLLCVSLPSFHVGAVLFA